jgi:hypothetical protein
MSYEPSVLDPCGWSLSELLLELLGGACAPAGPGPAGGRGRVR